MRPVRNRKKTECTT
jgi:hypothetical protein